VKNSTWDYGSGALIIVIVFIGLAAVIYGLNVLPFDFLIFPAWIFCPLGVYTLVYALITRKNSIYYLVWGSIIFAVGIISALYKILNPVVILGVLLIIIAVIGVISRGRRKVE
jgi:hypothetical protein